MRVWLGIVAAATGLAFLASAQAQDASRAHLLTMPDAASLSDHFPVVALARGESGRAVLSCAVAADGSSRCTAAEETPAGAGFGAAATSLAQGWRFTPRMENGVAVASTARIPVTFQNPSQVMSQIAPDIDIDGAAGPSNISSADPNNLARFYPDRARNSYASGRALVACAVRTGQRIECALERESPAGWGFGTAAVSAATNVLGRQALRSGDRTRVTVDFAIGAGHQTPVRTFWETLPSGDDYVRYYPGRAFDAGRGGQAMLSCQILADRTLECTVASETPRDSGFGQGALQLSRRYKLAVNELGRPGHSVGDRIILPIIFALPQ